MATEAANEHVGEITTDDVTKDVDEVNITKPTDNEVKDETNKIEQAAVETEEKTDTTEKTTLVEELKKDEPEDDKSASKLSFENVETEEKSVTNASSDSSAHGSSKEEVDVPPVQKTESETAKEPSVSETVNEEIESVERTQELSDGRDKLSVKEETIVEPVTTTVDTVTVASSESTDIAKDEKSTTTALEVSSESTNDYPPLNDKLEQNVDTEVATAPPEVTDTGNLVATAPTEVTDTEVEEEAAGPKVPNVTDSKEVAEGSVVTEIPDVTTDAKEVSEGVVDSNACVLSKDPEESEPAAGVELSAETTPVIDNPESIVKEDVKVELEKQEDNVEGEKPLTVSEELASEAPITSSATETARDEETVAKELEVIPEPTTEVQPLNDKSEVVDEPSNELHETIENEKSVVTDSSEVTETKDIGERIVAEVPDVEKTDEDASATVYSKESVVNVSALDAAESSDLAPVTENTEGKLEKVAEAEKGKEKDAVEVEKSTLVVGVKNVVGDKIVNVTDEAKASVSEALAVEKEGLDGKKSNLVKASREFDFAGAVDKASAIEGEAKEVEIEQKQTETKRTLLDKFISDTSESKKEEETAKAAHEAVAETATATDNANPKADERTPEDTPSKASQRHSNNIMSKVKQSIVKVKKAIIGKSPSSKTMQTDAKDDTKAK